MNEYRLPAAGGRELLLRPIVDRRALISIAVLSSYGNVMEAVEVEASDSLGLARGVGKIAREANAMLARAVAEDSAVARERYARGVARNPWQTLSATERRQRGLV